DGLGHVELLRAGLVTRQLAGDDAVGAEDGGYRHSVLRRTPSRLLYLATRGGEQVGGAPAKSVQKSTRRSLPLVGKAKSEVTARAVLRRAGDSTDPGRVEPAGLQAPAGRDAARKRVRPSLLCPLPGRHVSWKPKTL